MESEAPRAAKFETNCDDMKESEKGAIKRALAGDDTATLLAAADRHKTAFFGLNLSGSTTFCRNEPLVGILHHPFAW